MGLDMYLYETKHLGHWPHQKGKPEYEAAEAVQLAAGFVNPMEKVGGHIELRTCVVRWRKANAVHGWFVANVQSGMDDCGHYEVTLDNLEKLVEDCKLALMDKLFAETAIPPVDGFFFGMNREEPKDEWYRKDLQETVDMLTPIIERSRKVQKESDSPQWDSCYFEYHSSW